MTVVNILCFASKFAGDKLYVESHIDRDQDGFKTVRIGSSCEEAMTLNSTMNETSQGEELSYNVISAVYMLFTALGKFPAGVCADLFGGRHLLLFGFLGKIFMAIITPTLVIFGSKRMQFFVRGAAGFFEGFVTAVTFNIVAHWAPTRHLTLSATLLYNSDAAGYLIAHIFNVYFGIKLQVLIYMIGVLQGMMYMSCIYFVFSRPNTHPSISAQEKDLFVELFPTNELPGSIPWKAILTDFDIWALFACNVGYNFQHLVIHRRLPDYFYYILHDDDENIEFQFNVALRLTLFIAGVVLAVIADYIIKKGYIPVVYLRSTYIGMSLILGNLFAVMIIFVGCNITTVIILLRLNNIFGTAIDASLGGNMLDNSRHYAGTVFSITCGGGHLIRSLMWIVFGYVLEHQSISQWTITLWLNLAICSFCTLVHFDGSRGERASWDVIKPKQDKNPVKTGNVLI
ncbi:sodium-dependent phosphate transport protein 3-like [Onthophagus taurus]|uniref:sodium-dependent phosphate transport protein 3-like n=1 Tax=Onthophagus taurus TaxID=166361 RepID=UPI0039BEAB14